jgi:hypothetical protein
MATVRTGVVADDKGDAVMTAAVMGNVGAGRVVACSSATGAGDWVGLGKAANVVEVGKGALRVGEAEG